MADAMETMRTRRSIRHYRPDPVPRELIGQVIEAGLYAPSGKNGQSTIILAVTDRETRDQLSRLNAEIMEAEPGTDPFYGAPAVLVVLADRSYPNWQYDGPRGHGESPAGGPRPGTGCLLDSPGEADLCPPRRTGDPAEAGRRRRL